MSGAKACEWCGRELPARPKTKRFCGASCRGKAHRVSRRLQRAHAAAPLTWAEAREELAAALELLPADIATLEERHPEGEDPVMDELIGGLETHLRSLEQLARTIDTRTEGRTER